LVKLKIETVVLTGSTGFIGANLLRKLLSLNKFKVHILIREGTNVWRIKEVINDRNLIVHYHDLSDFNSLCKLMKDIKPDYILHLATYGAYPTIQKETDTIIKTNFIGTINLLESCQGINYKCFIDTGSSSEYGRKNKPMKETDTVEPIDVYGVTKAASELYGKMLHRRYKKNIVHLRLFSTYGYYEEGLRFVPSLSLAIANKEKTMLLTGGTQTRDFVFIEDVVDAYLQIMKRYTYIAGETINIGTGIKTSIKDFALLAKKIGHSNIDLRFGAMDFRETENFIWVSDTDKMEKLLKWRPKHSISQGLSKTLSWFEKNKDLYNKTQKNG
jgi:nucleoside-diphosphate-sugar epimerase